MSTPQSAGTVASRMHILNSVGGCSECPCCSGVSGETTEPLSSVVGRCAREQQRGSPAGCSSRFGEQQQTYGQHARVTPGSAVLCPSSPCFVVSIQQGLWTVQPAFYHVAAVPADLCGAADASAVSDLVVAWAGGVKTQTLARTQSLCMRQVLGSGLKQAARPHWCCWRRLHHCRV